MSEVDRWVLSRVYSLLTDFSITVYALPTSQLSGYISSSAQIVQRVVDDFSYST